MVAAAIAVVAAVALRQTGRPAAAAEPAAGAGPEPVGCAG